MRRRELSKTEAFILLFIFLAIGGLVMYGPKDMPHVSQLFSGYAASR